MFVVSVFGRQAVKQCLAVAGVGASQEVFRTMGLVHDSAIDLFENDLELPFEKHKGLVVASNARLLGLVSRRLQGYASSDVTARRLGLTLRMARSRGPRGLT